ncbi:MAG: hypothetical protein E7Z78_02080 [Methanobrevibacter thaueri]|uniref:Ig-like domain repeat protein n=1 Tax=Methanobrevibacter thaueri TaxID=190975 RepID=UPI0026EE304F|nr:Ig-like domain repeat protein [Methanobrevibacter thaueri]MBE6495209.1 hypothetical protein [Methanobrevibacter thaueri]
MISLFLIFIFTLGAVSASENATDEIEISEDTDNLGDVEIPLDEEEDFEIGEDTITITIPDGTKGTLSVNIDGKAAGLNYNDDEGYIEVYNDNSYSKSLVLPNNDDYNYEEDENIWDYDIILDKLNPGIYNIDVIFKVTGGETFSNSSRITLHNPGQIIEDDDMDVEIDAEDTYIYSKAGNIISITAPSSIIKDLNIKINDVQYYAEEKSSTEVYVDISSLPLGEYTIVVTYNNSQNSTNASFEVINAIDAPEEMTYGDSKEVTLTLAADAEGSLKVTIDGKVIGTVQLVNGVAKVQIPQLSVGTHDIEAEYTGEDYDVDYIDEIEVIPRITLPAQMNAGENKFLTIEIGNTTGTVEITADWDHYATLKFSNSANISLAGLDDGEITIGVVFFDDNGLYRFEEDEYEVLVKSVPPRLTGPSSVQMVYTKSGQYKVKAYDTNAKPAEKGDLVEFKIGKKTYKAYTDNNGVATFKIPASLAPGKYKISASYEGASANANLVVKHLLKLKKVKKVKKSAKKIVLKATVKNVKNKKVVFKFKGKKYTAKTNKKGVAKVTIKKSVLKKLKVGKKVTYQATYLKDTVKKTVKVKK